MDKRNEEEIKELYLKIGNYNLTSEFTIATIEDSITNIMLGYKLLETLGTFTLNTKKKLMIFFHEKKKITIHNSSMRIP